MQQIEDQPKIAWIWNGWVEEYVFFHPISFFLWDDHIIVWVVVSIGHRQR